MDAYETCTACSCFIKEAETRCPFCGAAHAPAARAPVRVARMSRARWLALGSALTLVSCGGVDNPGSNGNQLSGEHGGGGGGGTGGSGGNGGGGGEAGGGGEGGGSGGAGGEGGGSGGGGGSVAEVDASAPDATIDVTDGGAPDVVVADDGSGSCSPQGTFDCNGQTCNAATQYCQMSPFGGYQVGCNDDDGGIWFPPECGSCPTCACITPYLTGNCQCVELDAGGIGLGCATCYGAPPTRLELLASA
jgi:hypothetical protein